MRILKGHRGPIRCLAYSPDGRTLASGGDDQAVRLWDLAGGEDRVLEGHTDSVRAVVWAPDGKRVVSGGWDNRVHLWEYAPPPSPMMRPWWWIGTPDGNDHDHLWQHSHNQSRVLAGKAWSGGVWSLAFAPDGWSLVVGLGNGDGVLLWLSQRDQGTAPTPLTGHTWPINAVAFAPDGLHLATGSHDRTIRIWDSHWGRQQATLAGQQDWVRALAYAADGRTLASGGDDGIIKLWDVAAGRARASLGGHEGPIRHLAFTPDGRTLMSGSWDATVRLWDPVTGRPRAALDWKIGRVHCLAIAPDGMTAAAGADGSILVWDLDPLD
jgi:WD40 repeat protein